MIFYSVLYSHQKDKYNINIRNICEIAFNEDICMINTSVIGPVADPYYNISFFIIKHSKRVIRRFFKETWNDIFLDFF